MTVYIEYVFIDNFVIDFLLIKTALTITGKKAPRWRLVVSSLCGAAFALIYPLFINSGAVSIISKILFGLALGYASAKFTSLKEYLSFTAVFLGLTFFLGGAVIGAFSLFNLDYSAEYSIALTVLPAYIFISFIVRLVGYFYRKKDIVNLVVDTEMFFGGKSVKLRGFFDTGNGLYDGLTPVIIVSRRAIEPLLTPSLLKTAKPILIDTALKSGKKISIKPDYIVIYSADKKNIFYNVRVCAINKKFNGYEAILHPALMENGYERIAG